MGVNPQTQPNSVKVCSQRVLGFKYMVSPPNRQQKVDVIAPFMIGGALYNTSAVFGRQHMKMDLHTQYKLCPLHGC